MVLISSFELSLAFKNKEEHNKLLPVGDTSTHIET